MDVLKSIDWIRAGTDETVVRGHECPDDEDLAAFFEGRLASEADSRLRDHLADCDHCLRAVALLGRGARAEVRATVPASLEAAARDGRFTRAPAGAPRTLRQKAAAAAFVAITTVAIWTGPEAGPVGDSTVRSRPPSAPIAGEAGRGPQVVVPASGETIPAQDVEFRWTRVQTAVSYQVRVVTLDGDVVWERRVFGTQTVLPAEVRLLAGETYLVRISAQLASGKTLESEHVRFRVRSP